MATRLSTKRWQDGVILLLGAWLVVSPWVLGYPPGAPAAVNAQVAGAVIAALAAFDLYKTYVWAVLVNIFVSAWVAASPVMMDVAREGPMSTSMLAVGIATIVLGLWEMRTDPDLLRQWAGMA